MKIAMIGHKRIPSREGGIEIVVKELSVRMVAQGNSVTCYNRKISKKKQHDEKQTGKSISEYNGVKIKTVPTIDFKGFSATTSSFFGAIMIAFGKYDIVHFHAEGPCAMIWIAKMFGKRCIATIHGLDWQRRKWGRFAKNYLKYGERTAVKYADEIIVLSENLKKYFTEEYDRDTNLIFNGVSRPNNVEVDLIKSRYNIDKDEYILYLGRIVPEKGIDYLIKAFKQIKTDKKLVIAGSASDTNNYYNAIQQLAIDDERIIFTDFVCGRELEELFSNAYIFTLPSELEGMSLSLLEAMSYGNCVLGSDIAEIAEVIEDKGVLFKKSNTADLQQKLQYLLYNPDVVSKYKSNVADFVCSKYSWDDTVEKTLEIYSKV